MKRESNGVTFCAIYPMVNLHVVLFSKIKKKKKKFKKENNIRVSGRKQLRATADHSTPFHTSLSLSLSNFPPLGEVEVHFHLL